MKNKAFIWIGVLLLCTLLGCSPVASFAEENTDNVILFTQSGVESTCADVLVNGTSVTISAGGEYVIEGECDNGKINILALSKSNPVILVLNNVILYSADGPVINSECKRLTISLSEGSSNVLGDSEKRVASDVMPDTCIYSANHLTITGKGCLSVETTFGRGIQCKDTLTIESGTIRINSFKDGIRANDGVVMLDGNVTITAQKNGIETTKAKDGNGNIMLQGGTLNIASGKQAFNAIGMTQISGCTIVLTQLDEEE